VLVQRVLGRLPLGVADPRRGRGGLLHTGHPTTYPPVRRRTDPA
jgi:hypothetical protein